MKNQSRLICVLPALNESTTVGRVVSTLRAYGDVVVVDDGSSDTTAQAASNSGAYVISHTVNLGYDQALQTGLLWSASKDYEYAVTFDADGQHSATVLPLFIAGFVAGADLVLGVRDVRQRWSEWLFSVISQFLWNISDPLCGMKGYRLELIRSTGRFDTYTSIGTEFAIRAARSGLRLLEVNVPTSQRKDASRFGSGFKVNYRIVRSMILGVLIARSVEPIRKHNCPSFISTQNH